MGAMHPFRRCPRWAPPPLWEFVQQQDLLPEERQSSQRLHSGVTSVRDGSEDGDDSSAALGLETTLAGLLNGEDRGPESDLDGAELEHALAAVRSSAPNGDAEHCASAEPVQSRAVLAQVHNQLEQGTHRSSSAPCPAVVPGRCLDAPVYSVALIIAPSRTEPVVCTESVAQREVRIKANVQLPKPQELQRVAPQPKMQAEPQLKKCADPNLLLVVVLLVLFVLMRLPVVVHGYLVTVLLVLLMVLE